MRKFLRSLGVADLVRPFLDIGVKLSCLLKSRLFKGLRLLGRVSGVWILRFLWVAGVIGVEVGVRVRCEFRCSFSSIGTGVNGELTGPCDIFSDIDTGAGDWFLNLDNWDILAASLFVIYIIRLLSFRRVSSIIFAILNLDILSYLCASTYWLLLASISDLLIFL